MMLGKVAAARHHPSVPSVSGSAARSAIRIRVVINFAIAVFSSGARLRLNVLCASKRSGQSSTIERRTVTTRSIRSRLLLRHHPRAMLDKVPGLVEEEPPGQCHKCITDWTSPYPSRQGSPTVQRSMSSPVKVNGCDNCFCISPEMCKGSVGSIRMIPFLLGRMDPSGDVTFITDGYTPDRWPTSMAE